MFTAADHDPVTYVKICRAHPRLWPNHKHLVRLAHDEESRRLREIDAELEALSARRRICVDLLRSYRRRLYPGMHNRHHRRTRLADDPPMTPAPDDPERWGARAWPSSAHPGGDWCEGEPDDAVRHVIEDLDDVVVAGRRRLGDLLQAQDERRRRAVIEERRRTWHLSPSYENVGNDSSTIRSPRTGDAPPPPGPSDRSPPRPDAPPSAP